MIINPSTYLFGITALVSGGGSAGHCTIEYVVIDGLKVVELNSRVVNITAYNVGDQIPGTLLPMPAIAAGHRFKINRVFIYSGEDAQEISLTLWDAASPYAFRGTFARATLDVNECAIYNEGVWTLYDAAGLVKTSVAP